MDGYLRATKSDWYLFSGRMQIKWNKLFCLYNRKCTLIASILLNVIIIHKTYIHKLAF